MIDSQIQRGTNQKYLDEEAQDTDVETSADQKTGQISSSRSPYKNTSYGLDATNRKEIAVELPSRNNKVASDDSFVEPPASPIKDKFIADEKEAIARHSHLVLSQDANKNNDSSRELNDHP